MSKLVANWQTVVSHPVENMPPKYERSSFEGAMDMHTGYVQHYVTSRSNADCITLIVNRVLEPIYDEHSQVPG